MSKVKELVKDDTNVATKENPMTASLEALKNAAAAMRSKADFLKGAIVKFDGTNGMWSTKEEPDLNGKKFIAVVPNLVHGVVKWPKGGKPVSHIGRVIDRYMPPPRHKLDERDESRWVDKRDPWRPTHYLSLIDPESGEAFVYTTSSQGGRDALAGLLSAYVTNIEHHPDDADKLPLVELGADSYQNTNYGRTIHIPQLDILGWVTPPASAAQIAPPAPKLIEDAGGEDDLADDDVEELFGKREAKSSGGGGFDDDIPFGPCI